MKKFRRHRRGFTLTEVVISLAISAISMVVISRVLSNQSKYTDTVTGRYAAQAQLSQFVSGLHRQARTTLAGLNAFLIPNASLFSLNRPLLSDPAKYERITYEVICEALPPVWAPLTPAGLTFAAPADCNVVACAANERPLIRKRRYPDFSTSSTVFTDSYFPDTSVQSALTEGLRRTTLGMTVCITSPPAAATSLAGVAYAYYLRGTEVTAQKRQFFVSKTQSSSNLTFIPNDTQ